MHVNLCFYIDSVVKNLDSPLQDNEKADLVLTLIPNGFIGSEGLFRTIDS